MSRNGALGGAGILGNRLTHVWKTDVKTMMMMMTMMMSRTSGRVVNAFARES